MAIRPDIDWFLVDTAVRVSMPLAIEITAFRESYPTPAMYETLVSGAQALRRLAPITNIKSAHAARFLVRETHYALERGGSYDDQMRMQTLLQFRPIIESIDAKGWTFYEGTNNKFRRPIWAALPGAEAAHRSWSTFMAWPPVSKLAVDVRQWLDMLITRLGYRD